MNVLIAGAGRLGTQIAQVLHAARNEVTLIDSDVDRVAELRDRLPGVLLVAGDACEPALLEHAGALTADVVIATTGDDEDNLVISLLAKRQFSVPRVAARVSDADNAWLFDARATTVVFVVRHAETEASADPDPELSLDGRERAARLAKMLAQAQPVRGLDAIFASEFLRTQQTVTPVSEPLALPVNVVPSAAWSDLPKRITREHRGEYVLVAGSTTTIPALIEGLSGEKVTLREDEYDTMFIVFVPQISMFIPDLLGMSSE